MLNYEPTMSKEQGSSALPHDWLGTPGSISLPKTADGPHAIDSEHLQFWSSVVKVYVGHYTSKDAQQTCYHDLLHSRGDTIVLKVNILSTTMLD
jgi:hypothetical protein